VKKNNRMSSNKVSDDISLPFAFYIIMLTGMSGLLTVSQHIIVTVYYDVVTDWSFPWNQNNKESVGRYRNYSSLLFFSKAQGANRIQLTGSKTVLPLN
jgi:hypothetical protein